MDERNVNIVYKICTIMYIITLMILIGIISYRQFALNQAIGEFNDIAIVVTINVIFLLGAIFYFGGITFKKFKLKYIITAFIVYVLIGFIFTCFKYRVLINPPLSVSEIIGKLYIIVPICGLLTAVWVIFAYLGKRKVDKDLE